MPGIAVGIDLGTSNSCVAIARDGSVAVLPNAFGEAITASVVCFREDGTIQVGNAAKANIIHAPGDTVYSSKRLIGRYFFSDEVKKARAVCSYEIVEAANHGVEVQVRGERYSLQEIAAMILREMRQIAEAKLGQPVTQAVITVPAYFNDNQRQATRDAGRIAGLEVLRILNEPTAAALSYGFGRGLRQRVAVYDLGGGTFDISILEIGDDVFEVLATAGDTFLGGDDLDDRIIDLLADEFVAAHGINLRSDRFSLEKLKLAAENAKKQLSVDDEVVIQIGEIAQGPRGPLGIERRLTAEEFGRCVGDLIQRTLKVCDEALQEASISVRDLDGVVLVGGPTRLPLVREAVRAYFQTDPRLDVDPDQVVAMGAAIHAAALANPATTETACLLDVTPLSLRIGVAGGLAETVIERNTPVPIEQSRTFTTFKDFQESVAIRVYQGESREADENELLGQFEFSGFRKTKRGEVEIEVSFAIGADGIVEVTARDSATGESTKSTISLSSGLSESEIQGIIAGGRSERMAPIRAELVERRRGQDDAGEMSALPEAAAPAPAPTAQTVAAPAPPAPKVNPRKAPAAPKLVIAPPAPVAEPVSQTPPSSVAAPVREASAPAQAATPAPAASQKRARKSAPTPPVPVASAPAAAAGETATRKAAAGVSAAASAYDSFLAPGADLELDPTLGGGDLPLDVDLELDLDAPPRAVLGAASPEPEVSPEAPTDERPALTDDVTHRSAPILGEDPPTREIALTDEEIELLVDPGTELTEAAAEPAIEIAADLEVELAAVEELRPEEERVVPGESDLDRHLRIKESLFETSDTELSADDSGDAKG
jgi:molecular chaperone DnaK